MVNVGAALDGAERATVGARLDCALGWLGTSDAAAVGHAVGDADHVVLGAVVSMADGMGSSDDGGGPGGPSPGGDIFGNFGGFRTTAGGPQELGVEHPTHHAKMP